MRERSAPPLRSGGSSDGPLALLLRARRFRVAADARLVRENLLRFGAEVATDAPVFVGAGRGPIGMPALSLGEEAGTLGPGSGGFVNVLDQIVAWNAPVARLPPAGSIAIVGGRPDELPDLVVVTAQRGLGVSWIISTGGADPAAVIRFLNADRQTDVILFAPSPDLDGKSLRGVLGAKPIALLGGAPLVQAMVRRHGGCVVEQLQDWLMQAELLRRPEWTQPSSRLAVVGSGLGFVRRAFEQAGLDRPIAHLASSEELGPWLASDSAPAIVLHTGPIESEEAWREQALFLDWSSGDALRALGAALRERQAPPAEAPEVSVDRGLRDRVREEIDVELDDHECKRMLKAYGVRVTRQAPINTPTGATKLARTIGLPVTLVRHGEERHCDSLPEVRQQAALLLDQPPDARERRLSLPPSLLVRERVADAPRTRIRVQHDRDLGDLMRVGNDVGLLPLDAGEARRLAAATQARRAHDQQQVAALIYLVAHAASEERLTLDLEIFVGVEPVVVRAEGRRRPARDDAPADEA